MLRLLAISGLALALAGCDGVGNPFQSRAGKVDAAFPLPPELAAARDALLAAVQRESAPAHQQAVADVNRQLALRAATCASTASISLFDSVAAVGRKADVAACMRAQDLVLSEWIGVQLVTLALRRPARVPPGPLPWRVPLPSQPDAALDVAIAEAANVVAVRPYRQPVTIVSVPRGEVLATLDAPSENTRPNRLSPNGALVVVPAGPHMSFIDTGSGRTLWRSARYEEVLAWLPEIDVTVLRDTKGQPAYLDHRKGTLQTFAAIPRASWALRLPGNRLLLGYDVRVALVEQARTADGGLSVQPVKQWRLQKAALRPFLMENGKLLVYQAGTDLAWLELASGEQGLWDLRELSASSFAKISETQVYMELSLPATLGGTQPHLFDVAKATLVPAEPDAYLGTLHPLSPPRSGYTRNGNGKLTLVTGAQALGVEKPLADLAADVQLARVLARPLRN